MKYSSEKLLKQIVENPSFLLLGQSYLQTYDGEDLFLKSILNKYLGIKEDIEEINYDLLFDIDISQEEEEILSWFFKLSSKLSPPKNFESITKVPWSGVYTSAIDTILIEAFRNEWRSCQPIYSDKQIYENPRNRIELHLNYLFGCINQIESNKRIPFNEIEKQDKLNRSNNWLQNLPELLTTQGYLCIEGYNPNNDWLSINSLYSIIKSLGENQVYLFSFKDSFHENSFIKDLIEKNKLIPVKESLSQFVEQYLDDNNIDIDKIEDESLYGKWININGVRKRIPKEIKSKLSKSALIIDDTLIIPDKLDSDEERYALFKRFLSSGSTQPYWKGYGNGFAFERSFVVKIVMLVRDILERNEQVEEPIVCYGQSSSGKTVGLGHVGYFLSAELNYPVLFIPRNYINPDDVDLDVFCKWAEDNGADFTFIIWDGMIDNENYYNLQNKLNGRGRKALVIGSNYKHNEEYYSKVYSKENFVEANIRLDEKENEKLKTYLKNNIPDKPFLNELISKRNDKNFLAILYRYLPQTKRTIQKGLTAELDKFSDFIISNATQVESVKPQTQLAELLIDAGLAEDIQLKDKIVIQNESFDVREQFIQYIMIPGQYGLSIPFELLLRCLGAEVFNSSLFNELKKTDIVKWTSDKVGNIYIEPRTSIEAEILAYSLGSMRAKVEVIKKLILNLKIDFNRIETNRHKDPIEIDFAVDLLRRIGPQSDDRLSNESLLEIAKQLELIRTNNKAYHPRLVLQEASFYREVARDGHVKADELLEKSEDLLLNELELFEEGQGDNLYTYLKVELASTLGTKVTRLLNQDSINKDEVIQYYNFAKREVFSSKEKKPENYPALDVIFWTTRNLINANILSDKELINVQADLFHLIDFVDQEGIGDSYKEKFQQRKLEIGHALDDVEISEDAFQELIKQNSAAGYYIVARNMLGNVDINMNEIPTKEQLEVIEKSYQYLKGNFSKISEDGRSLYLMFRLWWLLKAKKPLFYKEKSPISLSEGEWKKCAEFALRLKRLNNLYETPTLLYQEALAYFHLENYRKSTETFRLISAKSDYSTVYGSKRNIKHHIVSEPGGQVKVFSGESSYNINRSDNQRKGHIYIPAIRQRIPFMLNDFNIREVSKGQRFEDLIIAFNFRGPILIPKSRLKD